MERRRRRREDQPQLPLGIEVQRGGGDEAKGGRADDWRIDEPTRLAGRRGLATARAALAGSAGVGGPTADAA